MKVERIVQLETDHFQVGDVLMIYEDRNTRAIAVKETEDGMLFMMLEPLDYYPMFKKGYDVHNLSYEKSDLRVYLNRFFSGWFPDSIQSKMMPVNQFGDLLRIPTEKEIYGTNAFSEDEDPYVTQWKPLGDEVKRQLITSEEFWLENISQREYLWLKGKVNARQHEARPSMLGAILPVFKLQNEKESTN